MTVTRCPSLSDQFVVIFVYRLSINQSYFYSEKQNNLPIKVYSNKLYSELQDVPGSPEHLPQVTKRVTRDNKNWHSDRNKNIFNFEDKYLRILVMF